MAEDERREGLEPAASEAAASSETGAPAAAEVELVAGAPADECEELRLELQKLRELYLRKLADFDNYRKRQERERVEYRKVATAELLREILPVLDNLERALTSPGGDETGLRAGIELVERHFREVLGRHGVTEVEALGVSFDPTVHEAVQRVEGGGAADNTVVQVLQRGYLLGDRLLRPAMVVVATGSGLPGGGVEGQ